VKKAATKATKAVSKAAVTKQPKQPYAYDGKGWSGPGDFNTVENRRTGKMRPDNIDLNTPRSYW